MASLEIMVLVREVEKICEYIEGKRLVRFIEVQIFDLTCQRLNWQFAKDEMVPKRTTY